MNIKIRKWKADDASSIAKGLNNKKVQDNLRDGIPFPYTSRDAAEFISEMLAADKEKTFSWSITADDVAIGAIGVFRKENVHRLTAEMGYWLDEAYWGKGVMAEAVKQACVYIFENTDIMRIFAEPYAYNTASCRVLEKAGFAYEGTLRKNVIKNEKVFDTKIYSIINRNINPEKRS